MEDPKETSLEVDFSGVDLRNHWIVNIEQALSIRHPSLLGNEPSVFIAESYTVKSTGMRTRSKKRLGYAFFDIINAFKSVSSEEVVDFNIGKSKNLTLNLREQARYATDIRNSTLSVPPDCIPIGWAADDVADLWCGCISIAAGIDVRWISKLVYEESATIKTLVERPNIKRNLHNDGVLTTPNAIWMNETVHEFVSIVFASAWDKSLSVEAARDYARIMWHFVEYRLITNEIEDQARLISTTVEELLTLWEEHTGNAPKGTISAAEADTLWNQLDATLLNNLKTLLPASKSDQRSRIKRRLKRFLIQDMVDANFEEGLRNLFNFRKNDKEKEWFKNNVESRLEDFIDTRNKIAHEGRFPSKDSDKLSKYYSNMLMILPLIFFSIFSYTGSYVDLTEVYRRVNANRPVNQPSDETE